MSVIYRNERPKESIDAKITACIAIPVYGDIKASCVNSLWSSYLALHTAGIAADLIIFSGGCHVDDARNTLLREFLEGDAEQLVFIDADIGFDPVDLVKLIRHDHDVVGGTYPLKQGKEDYPVRYVLDENGKFKSNKEGLIEVLGLPGGFLKIKRHVIEKLAEKADSYFGRKDEKSRPKIPIIFERSFDEGTRWSGDYTFCRKWSKLGGKLYVDPSFNFEHEGSSVWRGRLSSFIRKNSGIAIDNLIGAIMENKVETDLINDALIEWDNGVFAGDAVFQATAILMAREAEGDILEAGSGLSTLLMAVANPKVKITTVENDAFWYEKCKKAIKKYGVKNVNLCYSPLIDYGPFMWYGSLPKGSSFDLFVCDGPPRIVKGHRSGCQTWLPYTNKILFHDAEDLYLVDIINGFCKDPVFLGINKNIAVGTVKSFESEEVKEVS